MMFLSGGIKKLPSNLKYLLLNLSDNNLCDSSEDSEDIKILTECL